MVNRNYRQTSEKKKEAEKAKSPTYRDNKENRATASHQKAENKREQDKRNEKGEPREKEAD